MRIILKTNVTYYTSSKLFSPSKVSIHTFLVFNSEITVGNLNKKLGGVILNHTMTSG